MKKNIPYAMFLRGIRYCSSFQLFINERESLRMTLLLNKYPNKLIKEQLNTVLIKFGINTAISQQNYAQIRSVIISQPVQENQQTNYDTNLFIHFTYCSNMRIFPIHFHSLWNKYFDECPINDIQPVLGTRNLANLLRQLTNTRDFIQN